MRTARDLGTPEPFRSAQDVAIIEVARKVGRIAFVLGLVLGLVLGVGVAFALLLWSGWRP